MPDPLYPLARRLSDLEVAARPLRPGTLPDVIPVLVFADDDANKADGYVEDLHTALINAEVESVIVLVEQLCARPAGLAPAWEPPRQYLDWIPGPEERNNLRPDKMMPGLGRSENEPAMQSERVGERTETNRSGVDAPAASDHAERLARAADRWRRQGAKDGTGDPAGVLASVLGTGGLSAS